MTYRDRMNDYSFDLHRIFLGDLPGAFYLEIVLRTAAMFVFALVLIRTLGKRSLGQLSIFDFVIIIALGSAVGDPMFYEDVPLLYGMVVVAVVVALERVLALLTSRQARVERMVDSSPTILLRDGVVDYKALRHELMSVSELFQALRVNGIEQLDEVALAVLEPSGHISIRTGKGLELTSELWELFAVRESGNASGRSAH
jgi:uncharacterized membrane protein YcaP (DUF421 family)